MKHTLKKKSAPLNVTLRIVISKDIISFMYDLYHLLLLLLELPHRLHPEGNVQHELNVFYFFCDVHTTLFRMLRHRLRVLKYHVSAVRRLSPRT